MESTGISLSDAIAYMPDNAGYFSWKYRVYEADVINYYWLRCPNNTRAMRYAEVLLLAAEASLQSGNASKAVDYVNKVRNRAQLPAWVAFLWMISRKKSVWNFGWKVVVIRI